MPTEESRPARAEMPEWARTVLGRVLAALGVLGLTRLRGGAWLWQRGGRLRVRRLGPAELDAFVVADPAATRLDPRAHQQALAAHLHETLLADLLLDLEVDVVLDVGANGGQFALLLRRIGYAGRIVSFEPVSTNLAVLREAAAQDPAWRVEDYALGEVEESAVINVSAGAGKLSSLLPSNAFGRDRFENMRARRTRRETIRVRRLDTVLADVVGAGTGAPPRIFLKLDTQGYDLAVLAGAGDSLDNVVLLQSEVSFIPIYEGMPHVSEQIVAYERAGFAAAGIYPVSRDRDTMAAIEFDLLMVRRTP